MPVDDSRAKGAHTLPDKPKTEVLSVELQDDPTETGFRAHPSLDNDLMEKKRTNHRDVPPGPFRDRRKGGGRFIIWKGLPVLEGSSLPSANWTAGLGSF